MSPVSPSKLVVLLLVTALFVPFFALSPARADPPIGGLYGGTFKVAVINLPDPDPTATQWNDKVVHELIYDSLARMSPDTLQPEPWLASSWSIGTNTVTFQIRTDAVWPDNDAPITAEDVKWNFPNTSDYLVTTSTGSVIFTFSSGAGRFFDTDIYRPITLKQGDTTIYDNGPFLVNETTTDHLTLMYNDKHWGGRPYLDTIRYDKYDNLSLVACAFIDRSANFIGEQLTGPDLTTVNYPCNRMLLDIGNPHLHAYNAFNPGLTMAFMGINAGVAPLNDDVLRLAISKTVDREGYTSGIVQFSDISDGFISPFNTYWFNTSIPSYRVPKAVVDNRVEKIFDSVNIELEDNNYMDWNYDGWRETPSKQTFTLSLLRLSSEIPALVDTLEQDIKAVGIRLTDEEFATYSEIMTRVNARTFTLFLGTLEAEKTPSFIRDYFYSSGSKPYFNYSDTTMDSLLDAMDNTIDPIARLGIVKQVQSYIATSVPAAPIFSYQAIDIIDKLDFQGWVDQIGGINNFWTFYELHAFPTGGMRVDVAALTPGNRLTAGESTSVQISVSNESGPIVGANVDLTVTNGSLATPTGVTDANGRFTASYTAHAVTSVTDVMITAYVTKPGHTEAVGQTAIAVHPLIGTIDITVSPTTRTPPSGQAVDVTIIAISMLTSLPLSGASVTINIVPAGAGAEVTPSSGTTDANGELHVTFEATVDVDTTFALQVTVTSQGYQEATRSSGIAVSGRGGVPPVPGPDVVVIVALVAFIAFAYGVTRSRRWEDSRRKK